MILEENHHVILEIWLGQLPTRLPIIQDGFEEMHGTRKKFFTTHAANESLEYKRMVNTVVETEDAYREGRRLTSAIWPPVQILFNFPGIL